MSGETYTSSRKGRIRLLTMLQVQARNICLVPLRKTRYSLHDSILIRYDDEEIHSEGDIRAASNEKHWVLNSAQRQSLRRSGC